jgi:hypothetical protein
MTPLDRPVSRSVNFGRGAVTVTLEIIGDIPLIRFRDKGVRTTFDLPLSAVYVQAVGRTIAQRKAKP